MTHFLNNINRTIDVIVDSTTEEMLKVYHHGNYCPFHRAVYKKIVRKENIQIIIVGGSVTYGADLPDRMKQRWSTYFDELINSKWIDVKFEVINKGVGACNIDSWVTKTRELTSADMIIVDLSVNDQGFELDALTEYYRTFIQLLDDLPKHPAILFHQAFRSAKKDKRDAMGHCGTDYITCCDGDFFCRKWWDMQDYVAVALHEYHVPFVSYRDLAWPVFNSPPTALNQFWNGMSHPDYKAHRLIGKLIAFGLFMQYKGAIHHHKLCEDTPERARYTSLKQKMLHNTICQIPLTNMQATDQGESVHSFQVVQQSGHWRYWADSKNKFGWIIDVSPNNCTGDCSNKSGVMREYALSLKVKLSETPIIQLSYLRSYGDEMGKVSVWLDNDQDSIITIDSRWTEPYSVTKVMTLSNQKIANVSTLILGVNQIMPNLKAGEHILHLGFTEVPSTRQKWKLLSLVSC